jgi:TRAP-type transport system periplasmic protein
MRSRVLRRCLQTGLLPLLFVSGPALEAFAQDTPAVTLRYTTGAPAKTPWVMQLERLVKDVDEESKSTIKIDPFIAAQLGNEQDTIQQIARGRIDMGGFSTGAVALVLPELAILSIPFLFKSNAEQDCIIDKFVTEPISKGLAKKGIKFLGWTEVGTADIIGKRPFVSPNDVNGLKAAAASNKVSAAMWSALGANPNPIGITEISSAFQTGLVDVQASVITFYMPSGLNKVAPVLTRAEIADAPGIIVMNQAAWDKLSPDRKSALERAVARRPADQLRKEIRDFEATLRGLHVKGGGQIVEVTREQREEWRSKLQPVWPTMIKEIGPEGDALFKAIETGRAVCGP